MPADVRTIIALWRLLDDIDTLDDACKSDDAVFRKRAYEIQRKRFDILSGEEFDRLASAPAPASGVDAVVEACAQAAEGPEYWPYPKQPGDVLTLDEAGRVIEHRRV